MFPILYDSVEVGVVPSHNGLGYLSDTISATVEQVKNSIYELVMEYPISGIHAADIAVGRFIKIKPNFTDPPQLFEIDRIGKTLNGKFSIYAKHISYRLSGYPILSGSANNAASACVLLENAASGWSITTDKEVTADFTIDTPASVKSYFVGRKGSFLDVYGATEIKYDNFHVSMLLHAGSNRGVTIRYGKNLLELSQEMDCSNLYTHVICFYKNEDTVITGSEVATGLALDMPKKLILDVSGDYETPPTADDLTEKAGAYILNHNLTVPSNNITLDFVQSGELKDRVDLCDTVSVYYEALGITAQMKCIRTKWDCLREKYIETEFGDAKMTLADSIVQQENDIDEAYQNSKEYTDSVASSLVDNVTLETVVAKATEAISGNSGGNIIWHDSNGDGKPDEILVIDAERLEDAVNVWRWNLQGIGHSSTGYNGTYNFAFLGTGEGVATSITTGTLDASRVLIQHLTATMIQGGKLTLGGYDNQSGTFELLNEQGIVIGAMDKNGLKFYGEGAEGARPYVLINNQVGFAGYDANDVPLFWVSRDEFHMSKCVAENEITACNKMRFIPITLKNGNTVVNDGIALVALVETGA